MLYNLIFKREALFTVGLSAIWLACSLFWELYCNSSSAGILMHPVIEIIVLHLLMGFVAFYFSQVLRSSKLVGNNDFSALFLSVALMSGIGYNLIAFQFILAFFVLLVLVSKIKQGFNQTENIISEFEMGSLSALLTMINPLFVVVLPFTYVALVNVKVNTWRGYSAVLLGFFFMFLIKGSYFVFTDQLNFSELVQLSFAPKSFVINGLKQQVSSALLAGTFIIAMNHFMKVSAQLNIKIRVYYKVWLWLSLFLLSGFLLLENTMTATQLLLCVNLPLLVLYQLAIRAFQKKLIRELAILVLLLVVVLLKL